MKQIPIFWPNGNVKDILEELKDTLNTRWWGQGPKVDLFEQKFGEKFGYKYPLFLNSGTSALELAYHLIGLKEGDEVISPILNCTAGATGLLRRGVKIVLTDIDKTTFNVDPISIQRNITPKTKAIVVVHLGGIHVDDSIYRIANRYKIPVITDAAQYHGATRGDYICYSFQAIKHMTTGDGGMLVLKNRKDYERAKKLRWFGIDREAKKRNEWKPWKERAMTMDIEEPGYKYQPTDIDASLGLSGLKGLDDNIKHRDLLADTYKRNLKSDIEIISGGLNWLFGILVDDRDGLSDYLTDNGVETNMVHLRNDIFNVMGGKRLHMPNMDSIEPRYIYLPINGKVTKSDVKYICNLVNKYCG